MTLQITPGKKEKLIEHTILGEFRRFQESLTISLPVGVVGKSVVAGHQQVDWVDLWRLVKNIARGTTDPGYRVYNLDYLFN